MEHGQINNGPLAGFANQGNTPDRDGQHQSLWQRNISETIPASEAAGATVYDALIVGAGITGTTTALLLQRAGLKCVLVDAHNAGYGTTGGTTAHINTFADTTYAEVEKSFDQNASRLFADAIAQSVQTIAGLVETYQIDCDFEWKKGYVYAETDDEVKQLNDLLESALRAGVEVKIAAEAPTPVAYKKAIVFDNQAQFHPLKYILALQKEFIKLGGTVFENALIEEVETVDGMHIASAGDRKINAKAVAYATHIQPGGINVLHFRNAPYRSYVIAVTLADDEYPDALVYDMQDPYHYFRTHTIDGQRYLIAGGADHKTGHGDPEQSFADLIAYTRRFYKVQEVSAQWSAQFYVPADGLPYIGKLPGGAEGIYTATGFNGNGMILGTVSALVISDLILGGESKYEDLFDPARIKPIAGFTEFVKENADVAVRFFSDRLNIDKIESVAQIPAGSGEIVDYEDRKLAIYKHESGEVHALDPVCTHAKCIVQWNNSEKSWDCPCHGARFDVDGKVLTGPARHALTKVHIDAAGESQNAHL